MNDFGGGVEAQGEHVADAVGDDQLAVAALIQSRPMSGTASGWAEVGREHQLAAVRVPGKRQGQILANSGVEGVGMMREENREGVGVAQLP